MEYPQRRPDEEIIESLQRQRKELKAELRGCHELIEAYEKIIKDLEQNKR